MSQGKISNTGIAFFSSLCACTFGLGCWQTQRFFEKINLMTKREEELSLEPISYYEKKNDKPFQRLVLHGTFLHENEIFIGPRPGPNIGSGSGGLTTNPQGYYVLSPFVLKSDKTHCKETVLINRGWIPRQFLHQDTNTHSSSYNRPTGNVSIIGVVSKVEEPRFFKPNSAVDHRNPKILLWTDLDTIKEKAKIECSSNESIPILIATTTKEESSNLGKEPTYPIQPLIENVGEFKVTPAIHAGYAVTWYGLFGAGVYMTRKLITKGR